MSKSDTQALRRRHALVLGAILVGALIGALITAFTGETQRRFVFDNWQRAAPVALGSDNVAVVMIDDESVKRYGEWPWQRFKIANLVDRIAEAQPDVIGIDIYFTQADPLRPEAFLGSYNDSVIDPALRDGVLALPDADVRLADVLGMRKTVMARVAIAGRDPEIASDLYIPANEMFHAEVSGTPPVDTLRASHVLASIDQLDGAGYERAFVNGPPDEDGVLRRVPLSIYAGDNLAPGFAVKLANIRLGEPPLVWDESTLTMGDIAIPAGSDGNMSFRMGRPDQLGFYSAFGVIEGTVGREQLAGKIVILGVGATGTGDDVATPLGSRVLGPLVQAQAVDAILTGNWLSRPSWLAAIEIAAALAILGLLLVAGYSYNNRFLIPAAGMAIALPIASFVLFAQANLLLDPARPLLIGLFAAVGLLLVRYALAVAELIEQRIFAAEQKKENEAARDIQMSMVPSATTLSRLDPRTEIGAVLEPAKSVGGDFFDAVKINEDKLLFLVGDVSGKGMPAALFMALSKTLAKSNLARAGDGLEASVALLNHELMEEADEEMGLTMLIGVMSCSTGEVQLVNAGHENPLLVRSSGAVETLGMVGGPPFCVIEFPYPAENFRLAPGDTLVVITDGATEAFNGRNEQFGNDGVLKALGATGDSDARSRATRLAREVRQFEGDSDPTDDLTIFALRYLGSDSAA